MEEVTEIPQQIEQNDVYNDQAHHIPQGTQEYQEDPLKGEE